MSLPQSSKEKSARIDWGYIRRPAPTVRWRTALWIIAALTVFVPLTGMTIAAAFRGEPPKPLVMAASRGPLASAHAGLDLQCEACHQPFERISGGDWRGPLAPLFGGSSATVSTDEMHSELLNAKCITCHAGALHYAGVAHKQTCAGCHRDHQGRNFNLQQLADSTCTNCHSNLPQHPYAPSITSFATDHPDFRPVAEKSSEHHDRRLKFSHSRHLTAGMGVGSGKTFRETIPNPEERKRYMALLGISNENAVIRLDCAACHELDSSRTEGIPVGTQLSNEEQFAKATMNQLDRLPKEPLMPPRSDGQAFLPVNFEKHCKACHPLTVDDLGDRPVPHRAQPPELQEFLREVYSARYIQDKLRPLTDIKPTPGVERLDPLPDDLDPAAKKLARGKIEDQVTAAMQTLFGGNKTCLECHYAVTPEAEADAAPTPAPMFPTAIVPPQIPTIWMPRAQFDHSAHRAMTCAACHPAIYDAKTIYRTPTEEANAAREYGSSIGRDTQDPDIKYQHRPNLPSIATCQECHSPARTTDDGTKLGGVGHGCTECHNYHHVDRWLQGPGTPWNFPPKGGRSIKALLNTP